MAARKTKAKTDVKPTSGKKKETDVKPSDRGAGRKRVTRHHKFTEHARKKYLELIAATGTKAKCARDMGLDPGTVTTYTRKHPEFAEAIEAAMDEYRDMLFDAAKQRAVDGFIERGIFDKDGNKVGEVLKKSDRLLEVLMKRADPVLRESTSKIEHKGTMVTATVPFDVKKLEKLDKEGRAALRLVMKQLGDTGEPESTE